MGKSEAKLSERKINKLFSAAFENWGVLVIRELRLHPCEMDIVIFDPTSLMLTNVEIKRSNWKDLLHQSIRGKLYCHFSIAAMPARMRKNVPLKEFESRGVGVVFYNYFKRQFNFDLACRPALSNSINRGFKRQLYQHFCSRYPDKVYA